MTAVSFFGKADGAKEHIAKVGCVNRQDVREVRGVEGPLYLPGICWDKSICADRHVNTANLADVAFLHQIARIASAGSHADVAADDVPHTLRFGQRKQAPLESAVLWSAAIRSTHLCLQR